MSFTDIGLWTMDAELSGRTFPVWRVTAFVSAQFAVIHSCPLPTRYSSATQPWRPGPGHCLSSVVVNGRIAVYSCPQRRRRLVRHPDIEAAKANPFL